MTVNLRRALAPRASRFDWREARPQVYPLTLQDNRRIQSGFSRNSEKPNREFRSLLRPNFLHCELTLSRNTYKRKAIRCVASKPATDLSRRQVIGQPLSA